MLIKKIPGVTVWGCISSDGIIGPIFFDGTVNGNNYLHMLQTAVVPQLRQHDDFIALLHAGRGTTTLLPPSQSLSGTDISKPLDRRVGEYWVVPTLTRLDAYHGALAEPTIGHIIALFVVSANHRIRCLRPLSPSRPAHASPPRG